VKLFLRKFCQWLYKLYCVRGNVRLGRNVHIGIGSILTSYGKLSIEDDVYIGKYCTIECEGRIGSGSMIANNVGLIGRRDHDYRAIGRMIRHAPWVGDEGFPADLRGLTISIEEDCWIGYGAIILSGVRIGRGAIIGAGSVVTKDVRPYVIAAGNPAKPVAARFAAEEVKQHERILYGSSGSNYPCDVDKRGVWQDARRYLQIALLRRANRGS
jgi:virginiamycin A acetyltransferase